MKFVFIVCQAGAEVLVKAELATAKPDWKFAFSRPGFLTFKLPDAHAERERLAIRSTFARTFGWSLGDEKGTDAVELAGKVAQSDAAEGVSRIHVWQRDSAVPGHRGFEPAETALAAEVGKLVERQIKKSRPEVSLNVTNRRAHPDERVLDVILVETGWWWFGFHIAGTRPQRWPGGTPVFEMEPKVSRAYYKLREALLWSGITIRPGDVCVELGSAPGGAVQLLSEMEANVIAVDPALLDDEVASHPNVVHKRCRSRELRKRELRDANWLLADMNVAPGFTLDAVEEIVTNRNVNVSGLVLTLKLPDSKVALDVGQYRDRVAAWGFQVVKTRQLAFNRREFCLVAARDRFLIRRSGMKQ